MLAEERQKIITPDASMAARRSVRWKQVLIDPVDHRPGVYVEQSAHFMGSVDRFCFSVGFRRRQNPLPLSLYRLVRCMTLGEFCKK